MFAFQTHPQLNDLQKKLLRFTPYANEALIPYFHRAGVAYPPKALTLIVLKNSKQIQLYAKDKGHWHFIRRFPILAAAGGPGPKLHEGDRQVPEGVYHIVQLNPDSRFDLSMELNYPNAFDRRVARLTHRRHLGGDIFIHGSHRSIGCVAIGNMAIQELFPLVYFVGIKNVKVIIAPDDLRVKKPIYRHRHPGWLPVLYARIKRAMEPYVCPLPNPGAKKI